MDICSPRDYRNGEQCRVVPGACIIVLLLLMHIGSVVQSLGLQGFNIRSVVPGTCITGIVLLPLIILTAVWCSPWDF